MTLQWIWPSPLEKLSITVADGCIHWNENHFRKQKVLFNFILYCHLRQMDPFMDRPPTLRRARHIPVPHHVQNLKWFKQVIRNHWISFRNATWPKDWRNSRSIYSAVCILLRKKTETSIQHSNKDPILPQRGNLCRLLWRKGRFPKVYDRGPSMPFIKTFPWRTRLVLGPPSPGAPQVQSWLAKKSSEKVTWNDPRFGNRFFWSFILNVPIPSKFC